MKRVPALCLLAYAILYYAFLYHPGLIRMDDFGYLRSVAETVAAGRPRTDAWLEPYTATLSSLCALAYGATGNFPWSTWGLQALVSLAVAVLLFRLLRTRLPEAPAALFALALCTFPVYAHKTSEFAGNAWTLAFVLGALLAYRHGRWAWFFPLVFCAFANRQNSLALLALPAWHVAFDRSMPQGRKAWLIAGAMAFACAAFALHLSLNHTVAQAYGIYAGWDYGKRIAVARTLLFGCLAALAFLSAFDLLLGASPLERFRANLRRPWLPALAVLALWLPPAFLGFPMVSFLTPLIGSVDRGMQLQWLLAAVIPVLLWTLDWRSLRPDAPFFLAAGYVFLSGLKGFWYDFYLIDVAMAALFYRLTRVTPAAPGRPAFALAAMLLCGNLAWLYGYRVLCDKQALTIAIFEGLERAGKASPPEMTDGTFGYLGWKLFDQYVRNEEIRDMAGFQGYVRRNRIVVETETPWRRRFKADAFPAARTLGEGTASIGYFPLRYRVRDLGDTAAPALCEPALIWDPASYRPEPYPLTNAEWRAYIGRLRGGPPDG